MSDFLEENAKFSNKELFLKKNGNFLMHYSDKYLSFLDSALVGSSIESLNVKNEGQISGILPFSYQTSEKFGTTINSLPFFGSHGGPLSLDAASQSKLIVKFKDKIEDLNPSFVSLIENPFHPLNDQSVKDLGLEIVDYRIGQFTPLPSNMQQFHVKTRNAIRKGLKLKLDIKVSNKTEDWSWMHAVHEQSIKALGGIPKTKSIFKALQDSFGEDIELWLGYLNGKPITGLVLIRYNEIIEYFTPVTEGSYKNSQALSALIYKLMKICSDRGSKLWNWGGTWENQTGVYRFKSRWGAVDKPYRYFNKVRSKCLYEIPRQSLVDEFPYYYLYKF